MYDCLFDLDALLCGLRDDARDVKKIRTRRYPRIKPATNRQWILKIDIHYPRVRVFLIPAC